MESAELDSGVAFLTSLSPVSRAQFLCQLSTALTVSGRALYHVAKPPDAIAADLYALNEIQHRISQYAYRALGDDEDTAWLRPVLAFVFEQSNPNVRREAINAWTRTNDLWRAAT